MVEVEEEEDGEEVSMVVLGALLGGLLVLTVVVVVGGLVVSRRGRNLGEGGEYSGVEVRAACLPRLHGEGECIMVKVSVSW